MNRISHPAIWLMLVEGEEGYWLTDVYTGVPGALFTTLESGVEYVLDCCDPLRKAAQPWVSNQERARLLEEAALPKPGAA
jgi:hypothetical protein